MIVDDGGADKVVIERMADPGPDGKRVSRRRR